MAETQSDIEALMVETGATATQVLESRERHRAANGGWSAPLSRPLHVFAAARLQEEPPPGKTQCLPNSLMVELQENFVRLFEAGASRDELQRFLAWPSNYPFRLAKAPMQNFAAPYLARANTR